MEKDVMNVSLKLKTANILSDIYISIRTYLNKNYGMNKYVGYSDDTPNIRYYYYYSDDETALREMHYEWIDRIEPTYKPLYNAFGWN